MKRPPIPFPNFYPTDEAIATIPSIIDCLVYGCVPDKPFIDKNTNIVAFGSCFAQHISDYLRKVGYNVSAPLMNDAFVNTFVIRQQFEWIWLNQKPTIPLRYAKKMYYDEETRLETKHTLDDADVFILTLGLSEVWDGRMFKIALHAENLANLRATIALIKKYRPSAAVILTLSPVPLKSTFRDLSCIVANEASKAKLRSAIDEIMLEKLAWYFPSYELARCFHYPYIRDGRHVQPHIVDFIMMAFDCYYCGGIKRGDLLDKFNAARELDCDKIAIFDDNKILVAENGRLDRSYRGVAAH